jgi:hypothetical protein
MTEIITKCEREPFAVVNYRSKLLMPGRGCQRRILLIFMECIPPG